MRAKVRSAIVAAVASLIFTGLASASQINTSGTYSSSWWPFGESNTATYGQTFTVGADRKLNSFSLWLDGAVSAPVDFAGYLYKWDGYKATGSSLYASSAQKFTGAPYRTPQEFSFTTGGITLETGSQYVAFLSASNFFDGVYSTATMPIAGYGADVNPGGTFVYYNNGSDFSKLTTYSWDKTYGTDDVWFAASFSPTESVPEPGTVMLLGGGFLGLAIYGKRRKNS